MFTFALLNSNKVQNRIIDVVASQMSKKLQTKVTIGDVDYQLFNKLKFDDLYVQDLKGDTLLFVKNATTRFDFFQFFKGKYLFHDIDLNRFNGKIRFDKNGVTNFNFIVKAFENPKKKKEHSNALLNFKRIKIHDSSMQIDYDAFPESKDKSHFDRRHSVIQHINADMSLDYLKNDSMSARIHSLSLKEQSGLGIAEMKAVVHGWKKGFHIPTLKVKMDHSNFEMDSVNMTFDRISDVKDIYNKVKWSGNIRKSSVSLKDFSCFVANFSNVSEPILIQGKLSGKLSSFRLKNLDLHYNQSVLFKGNFDFNGLPNIAESFLYADIQDFQCNGSDVQDLIAQISGKPFVLPKQIVRLGTVKYKGNISGFFSNLVSYGILNTNVGTLKTDVLLKFENKMKDIVFNGNLKTDHLQLGQLLNTKTLGDVSFDIDTKGSKKSKKSFQGEIAANIKNIFLNKYNYQNISMNGKYDGIGFDGNMDINDPNFSSNLNGLVDFSRKLPVFNFDFNVYNVNLNALQLTKKYQDSELSFHAATNLTGNSPDNINGFLSFDNVRFVNRGKELTMNNIFLQSEIGENSKFTISSDILNGYFDGNFKYSTLPNTFTSILKRYLPSISGMMDEKSAADKKNYIDIDLTMNDTKHLSEILELPFVLNDSTSIKGFVNDFEDKINLTAMTPNLSFGKNVFKGIELNLNNVNQQLNFQAKGSYQLKNSLMSLNLNAAVANDSLYTQAAWKSNDTIINEGELQAFTKFNKKDNSTSALITFLPTQIFYADSIWDFNPSKIIVNPDKTIDVRNFKFGSKNQYILIDGIASQNPSDVLEVDMNNVNIGYILSLIHLKPVKIEGITTGRVSVHNTLQRPVFESNLTVKRLCLNDTLLGDAHIYTGWNEKVNELLSSCTIVENKDTVCLVNGIYSFKRDSLNFAYDAKRLNIGFINRWVNSIVQNVSGRVSGHLNMWGKTTDLGFEGDIFAENAKMTVGYLQTTYGFTDTIHMKRNLMEMRNITIYDSERNKALLNGYVHHGGMFQNVNYDINLDAENFISLNTTPKDNDFFYGKAYASGNVHVFGTDNVTTIEANVTSRPKTKMYFSVLSASVANENNFITFKNKKDTVVSGKKPNTPEKNPYYLNLSMNMDITPDAEIQLITDPVAGDMISGNGRGNLRLIMDRGDVMKLYGGYTIEKGTYNFTLQDFFRKQFKIDQGSTVTWSGDPLKAQLNIRALYSLTASLRDLMDQNILSSTGRSSVPVNAVLKITDDMMHPTVAFDIDLPTSDETLKMQVKNLINTEEMMNRQIVYLLLFNKFYTPDYNRTSTNTASTNSNTGWSFLTTTLSGQLNEWLSQVSNNFSLGVNYRTSTYGSSVSQEYETEINFQPNNRFIVNGNLGYRDDNLAKNKIIGDLDVEYILTNNGKYRLKAYNHTVDRYSLRAAPFIQGVGILYREDFNSWNDLWKRFLKKNSTPNAAKKDSLKNNQSTNQNNISSSK